MILIRLSRRANHGEVAASATFDGIFACFGVKTGVIARNPRLDLPGDSGLDVFGEPERGYVVLNVDNLANRNGAYAAAVAISESLGVILALHRFCSLSACRLRSARTVDV